MASYRVVYAQRIPDVAYPGHQRIVEIATSPGLGIPIRRWTIEEVVDAMHDRDTFYTFSEDTGTLTEVEWYRCENCGEVHLRSKPDGVDDTDLEALPSLPS